MNSEKNHGFEKLDVPGLENPGILQHRKTSRNSCSGCNTIVFLRSNYYQINIRLCILWAWIFFYKLQTCIVTLILSDAHNYWGIFAPCRRITDMWKSWNIFKLWIPSTLRTLVTNNHSYCRWHCLNMVLGPPHCPLFNWDRWQINSLVMQYGIIDLGQH